MVTSRGRAHRQRRREREKLRCAPLFKGAGGIGKLASGREAMSNPVSADKQNRWNSLHFGRAVRDSNERVPDRTGRGPFPPSRDQAPGASRDTETKVSRSPLCTGSRSGLACHMAETTIPAAITGNRPLTATIDSWNPQPARLPAVARGEACKGAGRAQCCDVRVPVSTVFVTLGIESSAWELNGNGVQVFCA